MSPTNRTELKRQQRSDAARRRPRQPTTMRDTVLLSLLVCPTGGVSVRRHGQGATRR